MAVCAVERTATHEIETKRRMPQFLHNNSSSAAQQKFHEVALQLSNGNNVSNANNSSAGAQPIRVGNYAVQKPRNSFQGASDSHLDELIQACNQPRGGSGAAMGGAVSTAVSVTRDVEDVGGRIVGGERTLVPFFGGEESTGNNRAFDWPAKPSAPGKSGNKARNNGTVAKSNSNASSKANKKGGNSRDGASHQVKSPKHVGGHQQPHQRPSHAHSNQRTATRFAGSSFTVSPSADRLPMPSKLL